MRAAGEDSAVNLPGSLDLGDRLAEEIEEEQKKMEAKVGNMTCVLREMGVLNADNEIAFESEKRTLEKFDLGDRLAEKIEEEQKKMEAKVGNMTCVLREMGVLNADNEIDFESEKRTLEKFDFPDQWFKNR